MKKILFFLWQFSIPILWLTSVLSTIYEGFRSGYSQQLSIENSYPWTGVIFTIFELTLLCVFLYLILRPDRFTWSLYRIGSAFAVAFALSWIVVWATPTDQPRYVYVLGSFSFILSLLIFILLIITIIKSLTKYLSTSTAQ